MHDATRVGHSMKLSPDVAIIAGFEDPIVSVRCCLVRFGEHLALQLCVICKSRFEVPPNASASRTARRLRVDFGIFITTRNTIAHEDIALTLGPLSLSKTAGGRRRPNTQGDDAKYLQTHNHRFFPFWTHTHWIGWAQRSPPAAEAATATPSSNRLLIASLPRPLCGARLPARGAPAGARSAGPAPGSPVPAP